MHRALGGCAARAAGAMGACAWLTLAPAACVVEGSVSASASAGSPATSVAVAGPPPQPVQETPPPPPATPSVWIAGYWHWTGMRYTWIPGHWERAPSGAAWHPPRYFNRDGTYFYEPGGWARPAP